MKVTRHYVVRTNGVTAQRTFWKVLSRGFLNELDAEHWRDYEKSLKINKKYKVFIVSRFEDDCASQCPSKS